MLFVFIATRMLTRDKTSYIYDYAQFQVDSLARDFKAVMNPVMKLAKINDERGNQNISPELQKLNYYFGIQSEELKRDSDSLQYIELLPGIRQNETSFHLHLSNGRNFRLYDPNLHLNTNKAGDQFSLCLIEPSKGSILSKIERESFLEAGGCKQLAKSFSTQFDRGTREINLNSSKFLAAYHRLISDGATLVLLVPNQVAFESSAILSSISLISGLAIFMIAIGITILILQTITRRIDHLVFASNEISNGNLNVELKPDLKSDEISVLNRSFEQMKLKLKDLLVQTVVKARMEKELEAARLVQASFFPEKKHLYDSLEVFCDSLSASECGGDLFHHERIQDQVFFLFADITGHGVSSALSTAAVYGCFTTSLKQLKEFPNQHKNIPSKLKSLSDNLDSLIKKSSSESSWLSGIIGVIDMNEKMVEILVHSHPPIYHWRVESGKTSAIVTPPSSPIGYNGDLEGSYKRFQLLPGDQLIFLSDGITEIRSVDQKCLNRKRLIELMDRDITLKTDSTEIGEKLIKTAQDFFGNDRPDDITLAVFHFNS